MFGRRGETPKRIDTFQVNTLIGEGCEFEGNLNLSSSTRIDGRVKGNIKCEATLIIGETGSVEGNIRCNEVVIFGTVNGNIEANKIELRGGSKLTGDIKTNILVVEEGAFYVGHCSMGGVSQTETP